jgi:hypothetical protein
MMVPKNELSNLTLAGTLQVFKMVVDYNKKSNSLNIHVIVKVIHTDCTDYIYNMYRTRFLW